MITIELSRDVQSKDWAKVASRMATRAAEDAGLTFKAAEVLVLLPERGRCLTKKAGATSFTAYG